MMTDKNITILSFIVLLVLIGSLSLYIYVDSLNDKIKNLNSTVNTQQTTIKELTNNVINLTKNIESYNKTLSITSEYINNLEKINKDENLIKDAILNEVVNDNNNTVKDWYNEKLPVSIINILNDSNNFMCEDGI